MQLDEFIETHVSETFQARRAWLDGCARYRHSFEASLLCHLLTCLDLVWRK